jgi:hypothetical protein
MPRGLVGQTSTVELLQEYTRTAQSTASSTTVAVTVPDASNLLMVIAVAPTDSNDTNLPITGVTVNGSATGVTKAIHSRDGNNDTDCEIWYKLAPAAGTYNVVVTATGSVWKGVVIGLFSGVKQQAPEATSSSQGTATSLSAAITSLTNYSLILQAANHKGSFSTAVAPATVVGTIANQSFEHCSLIYKLESTAGSTTLRQNWGSSNSYSQAMAAFAPADNIVTRTEAAARTTIPSLRTVASI